MALRCIARQPVEVRECDRAVAGRAANMDLRLQDRERHAHVGWVRRDAGLTAAEDGVHAIVAVDCRATAARLAFVAGRRYVVEVMAARTLQEVAARRCHVAELLRGTGHDRAGENRIALFDDRVIGEIGVAYERPDTQTPFGMFSTCFSGSRVMSITFVGRSTSIFIKSIRLVPPATNFAFGSSAIRLTASLTSLTRAYWKVIMIAPSLAGSPR